MPSCCICETRCVSMMAMWKPQVKKAVKTMR